ncbi:MarR family winged helix-turn-helix transcriptional regulator [Paenibacillus sp. Aloe-11]|uniref:MarR family winged helix-turn-helix transcriptional regulator n=1 Tax=Paenibacillus sp. Aloe-11 TaxID=1050222 RepID=UPI00024F0276|nr:MarR family transcriptional regulator [Paenibacillus sp. Aloe-11]EHS58680.1 transcriptional regulator [Paenibacillus sp. Aloe-11]
MNDLPIGMLLGITHRKMSQQLSLSLKPYDISPEQWLVLYQIYQAEGLNQKEIAAKAVKDQPTTTRIIDLLDKKGWVRRVNSPQDRRAYLLHLTEAGRQLVEKTLPVERDVNLDFVKGLSSDELQQFRQTLLQIHANISESEQQGEND